ncbi:FG-GAP-like repeat-containing protein [Tautonia marina]|uniref:FG-GAP-like repeat-containing protein n=1 Tax=Tautonia marina TaxID=2653855 RepID=UPI0012605986|nr:FG-GAP-like repeat-containing protein [Tautonia marina]
MSRRTALIVRGSLVGVALAIVGLWLAYGAVRNRQDRQFEARVDQAGADLEAGRFESARDALRRLVEERPEHPRAAYYLGLTERDLGDHEAAIVAWDALLNLKEGEFGPRAALASARLLIDEGQLAWAELILRRAIDDPAEGILPETLAMLREQLVRLLFLTGRRDETRPVLEAVWTEALKQPPGREWAGVSSPRNLLRQYSTVDLEPPAIEEQRSQLETAFARFPEDDRVWLGLLHLAIEDGRLEEASRWLDQCLERRRDDPAVRIAQLRLAMAQGDEVQAKDALEHLPEDRLSPVRLLAIEAWFADRRGDLETMRSALDRLLTLEPGNPEALERLAECLVRVGEADEAARVRSRKAALDVVFNRYRDRHYKADLIEEGPQLAQWAETLGRRFEAEAWWTLIARTRGHDDASRAALSRLREIQSDREPGSEPTLVRLLQLINTGSLAEEPSKDEPSASGTVQFVDAAASAGLDFVHDPGRTADRQLPETMSGGVALLDVDGDCWLDIFAVQGGPLTNREGLPPGSCDRLYRNQGDGTFEDITEPSGLGGTAGYGIGAAVGDLDNDGHPDLLVTRLGGGSLYRNRGDGTFEDITEPSGLGTLDGWPTSATFADIDNDGDLDLYITRYVIWDVENPIRCQREDGSFSYCHPLALTAQQDRLYRNDAGRFVDISEEAGIRVPQPGRGLGVLAADLDSDGWIDLSIANDATANFFFRNRGDGTFEEMGEAAGLAANAQGGYQAGMGIACGDLNDDGRIDLLVTNFFGEGTTYYENLGDGQFFDRSASIGLLSATRSLLGFGTALMDANNDGHLDLFTVNGHVDDFRPQYPYAMPTQLLMNDGQGRLVPLADPTEEPWGIPRLGRGLAVGDIDRDDRVDAVALFQGGPLGLFLNRSEHAGHAIALRLEGTRSNRDAIGAVCSVWVGERRWVVPRVGGGSYQSASSPWLHVGLGEATRIDRLEIAWPSGLRETVTGLQADRRYLMREGEAQAIRLP